MKNKILLIFFLLLSSIHGYDVFDISKNENINEYLYCVEDKSNNLDSYKILKNRDLEKFNKRNLGYNLNSFWCRTKIINTSSKTQKFILYNPRPAVDIIDVAIYENNKIIKNYTLGDMRDLKNRSYESIFSNFELKLTPNQKVTIVTKYASITNIEIGWDIKSYNEFLKYMQNNFTYIIIYIGFMLALLFVKIFNFYYIKDKLSFIYSIFILSAIICHLSTTGMTYYFFYDRIDLFTITISSSIFSHLFLGSLWLFTYYFFNINKKSKLFYLFWFIITYNIVIMIVYSYSYIDLTIMVITPIVLLLALIETLVLFLLTIYMLYKKKPGSFLFFIAHFFYVNSIIYYIVTLTGKENDPIKMMHITAFGIFLATVFMSLALSSRFKTIKDENDAIKLNVEKNKQFTLIGTSISYVTHQWKQPLSILASQLMKIQAYVDNKPDTKISELKEDVDNMQKNIYFINETLNSIRSFFKLGTSSTNSFDLKIVFEQILKDFKSTSNLKNIEINLNCEHINLNGEQNLFIHAIKNIMQNSIDAFISKNIDNPKIEICVYKEKNNSIKIEISDNAEGIKLDKINDIFEPNFSTKSTGMGIGLSFTKNIIESQFKGDISIENVKDGVKFTINIEN